MVAKMDAPAASSASELIYWRWAQWRRCFIYFPLFPLTAKPAVVTDFWKDAPAPNATTAWSDTTPIKNVVVRYRVLRGYGQHEDKLVHDRMTRTLSINAFLFSAYGVLVSADKPAHKLFMLGLGIVVAFVGKEITGRAAIAISAAQQAVENLHWFNDNRHGQLPGIARGGTIRLARTIFASHENDPARMADIQILLILAWSWVLLTAAAAGTAAGVLARHFSGNSRFVYPSAGIVFVVVVCSCFLGTIPSSVQRSDYVRQACLDGAMKGLVIVVPGALVRGGHELLASSLGPRVTPWLLATSYYGAGLVAGLCVMSILKPSTKKNVAAIGSEEATNEFP